MLLLGVGGEPLLEAPVALLEDDHVAEPAGAGSQMEADLLDIVLDLLAAPDWISAEDTAPGTVQ